MNDSYLEFDEDWDDAYDLQNLKKGKSSFNEGIALPRSIMKRLGIKSKWIDVTPSICRDNGGKMSDGVCKAKWSDAERICRASGRLPTINELEKVVTNCGGVSTKNKRNRSELWDKNRANQSYQKCYKSKGFSSSYYWSSSTYDSNSAWIVGFYDGYLLDNYKYYYSFVRCVRAGE